MLYYFDTNKVTLCTRFINLPDTFCCHNAIDSRNNPTTVMISIISTATSSHLFFSSYLLPAPYERNLQHVSMQTIKNAFLYVRFEFTLPTHLAPATLVIDTTKFFDAKHNFPKIKVLPLWKTVHNYNWRGLQGGELMRRQWLEYYQTEMNVRGSKLS